MRNFSWLITCNNKKRKQTKKENSSTAAGTHTLTHTHSLAHRYAHTPRETYTQIQKKSESQLTESPSHAGLGRLHLQCSWSDCCPVACRKEGKVWRMPGNHAALEHHVLSSTVTKVSLHPLAVFACHQEKASFAWSLPRCSVSPHWLSERAACYSTLKPVRSQ